ncbi:hypothetical protein J6590_105110, partial [Homalodisca vitripennis]
STPTSTLLRRQFCHAWKAPWNSSTGMPLSTLITSAQMFPTNSLCFPLSSLFSKRNKNRDITGLDHNEGLVLGRVDGNDE